MFSSIRNWRLLAPWPLLPLLVSLSVVFGCERKTQPDASELSNSKAADAGQTAEFADLVGVWESVQTNSNSGRTMWLQVQFDNRGGCNWTGMVTTATSNRPFHELGTCRSLDGKICFTITNSSIQ